MAMKTLGALVQQVVLLLLLGGHHVHGQEDCCAVKEVTGEQNLPKTIFFCQFLRATDFTCSCIALQGMMTWLAHIASLPLEMEILSRQFACGSPSPQSALSPAS